MIILLLFCGCVQWADYNIHAGDVVHCKACNKPVQISHTGSVAIMESLVKWHGT